MRPLVLLAFCSFSMLAQLAPPNSAGVSIGHVHLMVSDPEAQKKLWVGVFGAEVTNAGSLELLRLPGIFVVVQKSRNPPSGGSDGSTVNHFGFLVKSYAENKAKLASANVPFTDNAGKKQVMAEFPEKVRVEFTEGENLQTPIVFHHMHLVSTDPEKLRDWYVKTFSGKAGKREQWLSAEFPGGELDFRKADAPQAPTKGRSLDHIGFEIAGLETFSKKLADAGMPFDFPYRVLPQLGGLQIAFILDPEGTRIELTDGFMAKSH
jgi:catechol 2,3-dioxygenase-like lactoylglutathione lyase family enzyme